MYIHWLGEISGEQEEVVGGKGANLARLARLGVPVSPGFCINLQAYQQFIASTEVGAAVERFLDELGSGGLQETATRAAVLQGLFVPTDRPIDRYMDQYLPLR